MQRQIRHKMLRKFLFSVAVVFSGATLWVAPVLAAVTLPAPSGFVNDLAHILTPAYRDSLEQELELYEKGTGNEIAVLTVTSLDGDTIDDFAVRAFEQWKIGKKGKDNGVLLAIAKEDRKVRIEVGYGAEEYITDSRAGAIIRDQIAPAFQKEAYDEGVRAAVTEIKGYLGGDPAPADDQSKGDAFAPFIFFGFVFFQIIIGGLFRVMARSESIVLGGVVGVVFGAIASYFVGLAGAFFFIPPVLFGGAGLVIDWALSRYGAARMAKGLDPIGWIGRGGGGSSWGGGGGFGGFGGGSSGGGGASGGW